MIQILHDNPLLLLFVVAALGYLIGQVKIRGIGLGVAAVLFVGIAIGGLDQSLALPELFYQLGLVLFVYTVGLSSGPGFFTSFRGKGLANNLLVAGLLVLAFAMTWVLAAGLHLAPTVSAGMFAGSLTNTPALAAILDYVRASAPAALRDTMLNEPVIGYSVTYPIGVIGMIFALALMQRVWKVDYAHEAEAMGDAAPAHAHIESRTIRVERPAAAELTVQELLEQAPYNVVYGRIKHGDQVAAATAQTHLAMGDLLTAVGEPADLDRVTEQLGEASDEQIELDRSQMDFRRVFVSNPNIAGHRVGDLNLGQQFGAIITRVRRGDNEFLAHDDTILEPGDRVRVVTQRENLNAVSAFLGDSYRALSEIDILTFGLGLALGLIVGIIPIPLPGGVVIKLGLAGGPLIMALILGALGRTGPLVWSLPYSANLTLRQLGLVLFLAGIGTRAGYAFFATLTQGGGLAIFLAGGIITLVVAFALLWIGYKVLHIPFGFLSGVLAGFQTQPAILGFALTEVGDDTPNMGYASVYPVALIVKVILAQLLITFLK